MKRIELTKDRKALFLSTGGALLAEFLGTNAQGLELVAKFNQHAELVKALRTLANGGDAQQARSLLVELDCATATSWDEVTAIRAAANREAV